MSSDQTGQLLGSQAQRIRDIVIKIQNDKAHSFIAVVAYVFGNRHCFRPQGWKGEGRGKSKRADMASGPRGGMVREEGKAGEQSWTPRTACPSLSWWHRRRKSWFLKPDEMQSFFLIEYTEVGLPYLNMCTPQVSHCWSCPLLCRNIFAWCSPIYLICFSGLSFRESYKQTKKSLPMSRSISPLFSSKSFTVSGLTFKSLIYIKLIFVKVQFHSFPCGY